MPVETIIALAVAATNIIMVIGAGIGAYHALRLNLRLLTSELTEVKVDLKELAKIVTIQAVQDERILSVQNALAAFRGEYNERHKNLTERVKVLEDGSRRPEA